MPKKGVVNVEGLNEVHCTGCGRFLGYELIVEGMVMIYCKNCKSFTSIEGEPLDTSVEE